MPLPISLKSVVGELQIQNDVMHVYIHRKTGEMMTIIDDEEYLDEDDLVQQREVLTSDDYLQMPTQRDLHEYRIMEAFCYSVEHAGRKDRLLEAIRGRGAFRRFRNAVERFGLLERWYLYRDVEVGKIAAAWLKEHEIPFVDDLPPLDPEPGPEAADEEKRDAALLERIVVDAAIMSGQPVIEGTRLTVAYVLGLLAHGATEANVLSEYPNLVTDDLRACLLFASRALVDAYTASSSAA